VPEDVPLHEHETEVDCFYVLDGEREMTVGDTGYAAGAGMLACVLSGVRHTFAASADTARFLNIHAPDGGFAGFRRRASE